MVRPPQAAVYLFLLETTVSALESGYLKIICDTLLDNLSTLPGDSRTQIGFITFNSSVHFYDLSGNTAKMMVVTDVEDVFVPLPDGLLVKLDEFEENVRGFLRGLPGMWMNGASVNGGSGGSCLGAAVSVAQKLLVS